MASRKLSAGASSRRFLNLISQATRTAISSGSTYTSAGRSGTSRRGLTVWWMRHAITMSMARHAWSRSPSPSCLSSTSQPLFRVRWKSSIPPALGVPGHLLAGPLEGARRSGGQQRPFDGLSALGRVHLSRQHRLRLDIGKARFDPGRSHGHRRKSDRGFGLALGAVAPEFTLVVSCATSTTEPLPMSLIRSSVAARRSSNRVSNSTSPLGRKR